jgi:hypothetical protein
MWPFLMVLAGWLIRIVLVTLRVTHILTRSVRSTVTHILTRSVRSTVTHILTRSVRSTWKTR